MAKEMIAMLLAGGQGSRLYALTQKLAKPAVPFGGKYRIIDFPLSNCVMYCRRIRRHPVPTGIREPQTQSIRTFRSSSATIRSM